MGVKNLIKLIKRYAPDAIKPVYIHDLRNKRLAIDANLMIYKSIYALRKALGDDIYSKTNDGSEGIKVTHIYTIFLKLAGLKRNAILPIFVFDNRPHLLKHKTIQKRDTFLQNMKEKFISAKTDEERKKFFYIAEDITSKEYDDIKKLIELFGYSWITSEEEADSQCAKLCKERLVDGVITDDGDILLFGADMIIKNFSIAPKRSMEMIVLQDVLKGLDINYDQFVELGILLGTDYIETINKIGYVLAYKLIKKYKTIDAMIEADVIGRDYNYKPVKDYLYQSIGKDIRSITFQKPINTDVLSQFLGKFGLTESKVISNQIQKINNLNT